MSAIRTVDFDRLASSAPLNKQAAVDYHASGEQPSTATSGGHVLLAPPPTRAFHDFHGTMSDLTGRRYGSLVVLGLKDKEPTDGKHAPARWVCRCDCGNYTLRRHEKIARYLPDAPASCPTCDHRHRVLNGGTRKAEKRVQHAIRMAREKSL